MPVLKTSAGVQCPGQASHVRVLTVAAGATISFDSQCGNLYLVAESIPSDPCLIRVIGNANKRNANSEYCKGETYVLFDAFVRSCVLLGTVLKRNGVVLTGNIFRDYVVFTLGKVRAQSMRDLRPLAPIRRQHGVALPHCCDTSACPSCGSRDVVKGDYKCFRGCSQPLLYATFDCQISSQVIRNMPGVMARFQRGLLKENRMTSSSRGCRRSYPCGLSRTTQNNLRLRERLRLHLVLRPPFWDPRGSCPLRGDVPLSPAVSPR